MSKHILLLVRVCGGNEKRRGVTESPVMGAVGSRRDDPVPRLLGSQIGIPDMCHQIARMAEADHPWLHLDTRQQAWPGCHRRRGARELTESPETSR